jgi:enoyl-CoA hydratase/carnithine racemase
MTLPAKSRRNDCSRVVDAVAGAVDVERLIAEHGMSWMPPWLIGPMNALDLLMTGRPVTALEAEKLGLLRCLPAEGFLIKVRAIADDLAIYSPPRSTAVIKRQVYDALLQSLGEACAIGLEVEIESFASEDFREGVAQFMKKSARRSSWGGEIYWHSRGAIEPGQAANRIAKQVIGIALRPAKTRAPGKI